MLKRSFFLLSLKGRILQSLGNRQIQKSFSEWIQQSKKGIAVLLLWKRIKHFICLAKSKRHFLCWSNRKVIWGKDYSLKPWEPQALPLRKWEQSINYQRKQTSLKLIKISAEIKKTYHRISPKNTNCNQNWWISLELYLNII